MVKKDYNWLKRLQEGKGKDLSRFFFVTFTNEEIATAFFHTETYKRNSLKCLNPKAKEDNRKYKRISYIDRNINRLCNEWQKEGFIEESRPIEIEVPNRWGGKHKQKIKWKIINLEPIYKFCREKGIDFSEDEKSYLKSLFLNENFRKLVINDFQDEDIINATLKFYVNNCIMRYLIYLKDIRENSRKYESYKDKVEELNNPKNPGRIWMKKMSNELMEEINKRFPTKEKKREQSSEFSIIKLISMDLRSKTSKEHFDYLKDKYGEQETVTELLFKEPLKLPFQPMDEKYYALHRAEVFHSYIYHLEEDREIVTSVDQKLLNALNLLPLNPKVF